MQPSDWIKSGFVAASLGISAIFAVGPAQAVPLIDGTTAVTVTVDLPGLGLGATPAGSASVDDGAVVFPITGGSSLDGDLSIEHEGSGLTLFATADATVNVTVGNFVIETALATVFGDAKIGTTDLSSPDIADAPFFTFGSGTALPGIQLLISDALGDALAAVFPTAPPLAGAEFGYAVTAPVAAVPLPAGAVLLLGALGVMGIAARRRPRA